MGRPASGLEAASILGTHSRRKAALTPKGNFSEEKVHSERFALYTTFEPYVSAEVIAQHLSIPKRQVLDRTREGRFPGHAVDPLAVRKQWRYKVSEIDAFMAANKPKQLASTKLACNEGQQTRRRKAS